MGIASTYPLASRASGDFILGVNGAGNVKRFAEAGREILRAARTYYVRTDGNDSNDGLANTSGGAFLTIGACLAHIAAMIDCGGQVVTVQVGDGTYTARVTVPLMVGLLSPTDLILRGNTTTPANCLISVFGEFAAIFVGGPGTGMTIEGFKLVTDGRALACWWESLVYMNNMDFGACSGSHLDVQGGSHLYRLHDYTISGGAACHLDVSNSGIIETYGHTVTITGAPAFSVAFVESLVLGAVIDAGVTYTGAATGPRYLVEDNGVIATFGGGASYFPGDVAGSTARGGQYS